MRPAVRLPTCFVLFAKDATKLISREKKAKIIGDYRHHDKDTGSTEVQVAILTTRVQELTGHLKANKKDHHSRNGLLKLVSARRDLLKYLKRKNLESHKKLIERLGIRK